MRHTPKGIVELVVEKWQRSPRAIERLPSGITLLGSPGIAAKRQSRLRRELSISGHKAKLGGLCVRHARETATQ